MKQQKAEIDDSMDFELAMRQFFGDAAYHIADFVYDPKYVKKWLLKAVRRMQKDVVRLDTTSRHREMLVSDLNRLEKLIKESENPWYIIFRLFFLCSRFLGYDYVRGLSLQTLFYHQTQNQHYWSKIYASKDFDLIQEHLKDGQNTIAKQKEIIQLLKEEGYDDFHIALVLGMIEYKVKKLKKDI